MSPLAITWGLFCMGLLTFIVIALWPNEDEDD
jgi:hypothetical protein